MGGQDVFKGALGWDDWIWWSGIGGLGLLLLLLILCCVVCVQRAKRKGREEALAAVQARERERQTQEQAQLRYAQAQQARYPAAREASYKFSKPEPPQPTYNPYGQEDHGMHRNSYLNNAPVPKPKPRRGSQQPPGQQPMQQQPYAPPHQQQYGGGDQYYSIPSREEQQRQQQQQQQQYQAPPQYGYSQPNAMPAPRQEPEELPQVAAYYGRKPQPASPEQQPRQSGPVMSQQYQRQTQVNPNQPMIAQYRKFSSRSDATPSPSFLSDDAPTPVDTPFVQVSTPRGSATSTASTAYSAAAAAPSNAPPQPAFGYSDRNSVTSSHSSSMARPGGTLRDRIDALRDGSSPAPSVDNYTRISVGSAASLASSQPSQQPPQQAPPPPPPAPRRLDVISSTVLSDTSSTENEFVGTQYNNAFDEEAFATARSNQGLRRAGSDHSVGIDDELESPATVQRDQKRRAARGRASTGDSTGSIEF